MQGWEGERGGGGHAKWGRKAAGEPGPRLRSAVPAPEFAALFPAGANSECLLKSLHEAQLLNLFFYLQGPDPSSFFKSQASEKVIYIHSDSPFK